MVITIAFAIYTLPPPAAEPEGELTVGQERPPWGAPQGETFRKFVKRSELIWVKEF